MKLSFRGFLAKYCKELTSSDTTSLKKLFQLADAGFSRAYEPLLLLAICDQREEYLLKQAQDSTIFPKYTKFLSNWEKSEKPLCEYLETLEDNNRFKRPLTAWQTKNNRLVDDRKILIKVSSALAALLKSKGLTRAQACRLTKTNKGNFYAFLKGDPSKLSRKTAMQIYRQIEKISLPDS